MSVIEDLKFFYTKHGELDKNWSPYMVNRFISMNPDYARVSFLANKYIYYGSPRILKSIYYFFLPKLNKVPFNRYMKSKAESENAYKAILERLRTFYRWSEVEMGLYTDYYIKLFEDPTKLHEVMTFLGIPIEEKKDFSQVTKSKRRK